MKPFRAVIGLEVHAQLKTRTKMFCGCATGFGAPPNSRVCPVCLGLPGALPTPNAEAVRLAVRFALAIDADVRRRSVWARKNYFYPDLPKGYQITQFDRPLALGGRVRIEPPGKPPRFIGIERVHLEEDAGKLVHEGFTADRSGVDFNRCGTPLIEIVSAPELDDPESAQLYLERLRSILRATGVCDADMEKGELRCDANISVHREGEAWGTRVEIKNLNSFRHVRRALAHEAERQAELIGRGGAVVQETRLWNERSGATEPMRAKEEAHDYRYFPEPDLPPLLLSDEFIARAAEELPPAPHVKRDRFTAELGLAETDAHRLTVEPELGNFFEEVLAAGAPPRPAANWVLSELLGRLNAAGRTITESPVAPAALAELLGLVENGAISGRAAKEVFDEAFKTGRSPRRIVDERGLGQINDRAAIEAVCREVLAAHPEQVGAFRRGKRGLIGFFVQQVMTRTDGRANPKVVRQTLDRMLEAEL